MSLKLACDMHWSMKFSNQAPKHFCAAMAQEPSDKSEPKCAGCYNENGKLVRHPDSFSHLIPPPSMP